MRKRSIALIIVIVMLSFSSWALTQAIEVDTDRPGMNIRSFDLLRNAPSLCQQACREEQGCKAWTYVKPGIQGANARCWLKSGVPAPVKNACCESGIIELKVGAPMTIKAAGRLVLRPLDPPIQVLFPSKSSSLNTGEIVIVKWKCDQNVVKTGNAVFRIDLLDAQKNLVKELTNPAGVSFTTKPSMYQYDRQIPLSVSAGKHLIRVSLLHQQEVNGESGLFEIRSVPRLARRQGEVSKSQLLQPALEPPNAVKATSMKVISMNPVFYAKKVAVVETTVEVAADGQFKLAGFSPNPKDPVNSAVLRPKGKLVLRLFPVKKAPGDIELVDYDLAHDNPYFTYPKNAIMSKGKNTIKFTINVHPSMQSAYADLDGSWWGPLVLHGTYDNKNCKKDIDLRVQTYITLENIKKESMGVIPFVDVTQPRDDMDAREGFLFFKFFDINCN